MTRITVGRLRVLLGEALRRAGAGEAAAVSLIEATLAAERAGRCEVGLSHLPDYLDSFREGRIAGDAEPQLSSPFPALIHADAGGGIAQLGFDLAFEDLAARAEKFGIAIFSQRNSYTAGELGYYVRRLAELGLLAMAATNAHAMMAAAPGGAPVFSTNPFAFAAPLPSPSLPLVIDQATSATAFVNLMRAAKDGVAIPEGWAVDREGKATTDAAEAALGALLPFGGYKGANIALIVELLAAGFAGAAWSLDAGHFRSGDRSPGIGLTVLAMKPPDAQAFAARVAGFCVRLRERGLRLPSGRARHEPFSDRDRIEIDAAVLARLTA